MAHSSYNTPSNVRQKIYSSAYKKVNKTSYPDDDDRRIIGLIEPVINLSAANDCYKVHTLIEDINSILSDKKELRKEGIELKNKSIDLAKNFSVTFITDSTIPEPTMDLLPNGLLSFTWRKKGIGMINLLFTDQGYALYTAFFPYGKEEITIKGKIKDFTELSDSFISAIEKLNLS